MSCSSFSIANFEQVNTGWAVANNVQRMCVLTPLLLTWVKFKAFKNGPSKISLSNHFKFFKGYLPQILFGPFLNTFTHTFITLDS